MLWTDRHPRDKAGDSGTAGAGRDRQGPQARAPLTSALGDLQQAGAGDGDAALLLRGGSGGLLGRPMGGGPCRALRDQRLLAELCHSSTFLSVRAAPLGPQHSGVPSYGAGTAGSRGRSGGRAGLPQTLLSELQPPPRAAPLCRRDKAQPVPGPDKGGLCRDRPREEPEGQGSGGTRWWQSPWWWHTVRAQGWASPPSRQPGDSGAGTETPSPKGTGMLWGVPAAVELQDIARTPAGHQPSATGSATS